MAVQAARTILRPHTRERVVLWVEDDAQDRLLIGAALNDLGIGGVRFLTCGQELLDSLEVVEPARIVLDMGVPDVPGDELLRAIKQEGLGQVPVAVFSGMQGMPLQECLALGAEECVSKPALWSDYPAAVERALGLL